MAKYVRIFPNDKKHLCKSHTASNGYTFAVERGWTKVDDSLAVELGMVTNRVEDPDSAKVFEIKTVEAFNEGQQENLHKMAVAALTAATKKVDAVQDITTASAEVFQTKAKRGRPSKAEAAKDEPEESNDE